MDEKKGKKTPYRLMFDALKAALGLATSNGDLQKYLYDMGYELDIKKARMKSRFAKKWVSLKTLSDTFELQFRIVENDNDSGWVEKLANVGSDGTDILVKAMINIMLLNVFKEKASHQFNDFKLHCMMDEIGKLHPNNIKGILDFANNRNIILVNSSPTSYRASDYKYTYILNKDKRNITSVTRLIKQEVRE